MKNLVFIFSFLLISLFTRSQTSAFSETFESANSLTLVNGTQTNKWLRGSANQCNGTFSLFVSNNGSAYTYTNTSATSTVHAYFDVVIPSGATNVSLSFSRKLAGELTTGTLYDYLQVYSCINTFTPTAGTLITTNANRVSLGTLQGVTTCATTTYTLSGVAGTTRRIIFTWRNDASGGTNPPALIDNISVTYTPAPPPPSNDACSNATSLPCATSNLAGTTVASVVETAPSTCVGGYGVWYSFVGNGQSTTVSVYSTTDIGIYIGSGNCTTRTQIACVDDYSASSTESVVFTTVNGTTYYVYVAYYGVSVITGTFTISRTCVTVPTNDLCANATSITLQCPGSTTSTSGTTIGASEDAISDPSCDAGDIRDVWYSFNTGNNTEVSITATLGTATWLGVEIYTSCGTIATGLSSSCDFNILSPNPTTITGFTMNTTYRLRIFTNATYDTPGTFSIYLNTINNSNTLSSASSTNSQNICFNNSITSITYTTTGATGATFSGLPSGLSSSWTNNLATISGTPSASGNYSYTMTLTGGCGTSTATGSITVNPLVSTISTISGNINIIAGTSEVYSITPVTNASSYQWDYRESSTSSWVTNISSTTSATVDWPLTTGDGEVLVTATNGCGSQNKNLLITVDGILPIELLYFSGTAYPTFNLLRWATASEHISDYFDIQESLDGITWKSVGVKPGAGNSNMTIYYSYLVSFNEYVYHYYRLKQVDYDGNFEIFDIISLDNTRSYMKVIKYVNLLGQEVGMDAKGVLFEIYEDGSTKKVIK